MVFSQMDKIFPYVPNDPNLIEKLSDKGGKYFSFSIRGKNAISSRCTFILVSNAPLIAVWIFFMRQMQGGKGGAMGFG